MWTERKAQQIGLQQRDVAQSLLVATSGSFQTTPNFWLNPQTGVSYSIAVQSPQYNLDTLQDLENIPVTGGSAGSASALTAASNGAGTLATPPNAPMGGPPIQILGNVASISPGAEMGTVSHYNIAPVIDIYGNVANSDLASVDKQIRKNHCRYERQAAARLTDCGARPGADDADFVCRPDRRPGLSRSCWSTY